MERNMVSVLSNGQTDPHISENFIIITYMEKEFTFGLMEGLMRESGEEIKCMEKAPLHGPMAANM